MKKAADASPNQQLIEERLKRHWSQQEVADRVGTTAINVSRWERGMSTPGTYFRYQLCALYDKSAGALGLVAKDKEDSSKHDLPQMPHYQEPISSSSVVTQLPWNVPYRRNPFFTGRKDILERLHDVLSPRQASLSQPCTLSGLGGIGKTQTAIEYAYLYHESYTAILWSRADRRENLLADFVAIADMLGLLESGEHEQSRAVELVKHWLHNHANWLLILDNADDLTMLNDVLPSFHNGHVLLTTRTQITGTLAQRIDLEKMDREEGILFLLRRSKCIAPSANLNKVAHALYSCAREISQIMDGLPLALDQAGAYIEETTCDLSDYLDRYRSRRVHLLNVRGDIVTDHPASVSVTFSLAIEKVEQANPRAADLLRLCALLYPDAIPEAILLAAASEPGAVPSPVTSDALAFDAAIKELRKFSLLRRNPETKMFTIHRLVQAVIRDGMDEETQRQWAERTVRIVQRTFPNSEFATWQRCQQCLPHVQVCASLIEQWQFVFQEAAQLLLQAGRYIYEQASFYAQAEPLLQQSLAIYEQALGPDHPELAQSLLYLGKISHEQGKYMEAESLFKRALAIQEQAAGSSEPEHPEITQALTCLATFYIDQGKYEQAKPLCQRVLRIVQQSAGSNDLQIVEKLTMLASIYYFQGNYEQAESYFQQVLTIHEQTLPPEHPEIANSLFNLGDTCIAQEKYAQAQLLFQRTLAIFEQSLEQGHPLLGLTLNMLARTCYFQGNYEEAEPLFQQALSIRTQALGADHPCVAESLNNLAELYRVQCRFTEAEYYCQQSIAIYKKVWGSAQREHLEVAQALSTLAKLARDQGKYAEAESLFQQAQVIRKQILGSEHPDVARSQKEWANLTRSTT
ncbi:MAG: FxSxx-COOH system tetratricopeptide repeat protein [Ktedonobacteraceae bacterium]